MAKIRFVHTHHLSETEYVDIRAGFLGLRSSRRLLRRSATIVLGVACLFWEYTLLFGATILAVALLHLVRPRLLPATAARNYRELKYLHGPVEYGVDDSQLWLKGSDFEIHAGWRHAVSWLERGPWLVLSLQGMPLVLLPVEEMQAQGAYGDILALVQRHAVEFNSPKAVWLANRQLQ
jgi:hypothetical protein